MHSNEVKTCYILMGDKKHLPIKTKPTSCLGSSSNIRTKSQNQKVDLKSKALSSSARASDFVLRYWHSEIKSIIKTMTHVLLCLYSIVSRRYARSIMKFKDKSESQTQGQGQGESHSMERF
jgi:hypothetical protein